MKNSGFLIVAILAASSGFLVHVFSAEWLSIWVSDQMQGHSVTPSWNVRYVALLTSLEYGIAAIVIYLLAKEKLDKFNPVTKIMIVSSIFAAINGAFLRQPLMDFIIGNPFQVVIVQNLFKWLVWILMASFVVFGVDLIQTKKADKLL